MQKTGRNKQSRPEPRPWWRGARRRITRVGGKKTPACFFAPRVNPRVCRHGGRERSRLSAPSGQPALAPTLEEGPQDALVSISSSRHTRRYQGGRTMPRVQGAVRLSAGKALKNAKNKKILSPPCSVAASLEKKSLLQRHHFAPSMTPLCSFNDTTFLLHDTTRKSGDFIGFAGEKTLAKPSKFSPSDTTLLLHDTTFVLHDTTFVLHDTTFAPSDTTLKISGDFIGRHG